MRRNLETSHRVQMRKEGENNTFRNNVSNNVSKASIIYSFYIDYQIKLLGLKQFFAKGDKIWCFETVNANDLDQFKLLKNG